MKVYILIETENTYEARNHIRGVYLTAEKADEQKLVREKMDPFHYSYYDVEEEEVIE